MYYIPSHITNRQGTFVPRLTPGSDHAGTAGAEIGKSSELGYQRNIVGIWNMECLANFLGVDISNIEDIEELTEDRTNLG